jgi:DNA-directed RNA polymerase specialized sigma subunit
MPDYNELYQNYLQNPGKPTLGPVLRALDPIITAETHRYEGPKDLLKGRAKLIAAESVKTYDPSRGASLSTWVTGNLRSLSRYGKTLQPVKVPEVARQRAAELERRRQEIWDAKGEEPTDTELADDLGISVKKVRWLKNKTLAVMNTGGFDTEDDDARSLPGTVQSNQLPESVDAVYSGLSPRDRKIFDMKTGRTGAPVPNHLIAKRLGLTPAMISDRSRYIAERIKQVVK